MVAHLSIISLAEPKGTPRHPHGSGLRPCLMMARFDVCRDAPILPQLEHKRTFRRHHVCV